MKLIRNADDFVVLVRGPRAEAEALFGEVATVLARWACTCRRRRRT